MKLILTSILKNEKKAVDGNVITNTETELTEPGMPGSYASPGTSPLANALVNGVIGLGAGISGGAMLDKNRWATGLNTAAGSSTGYLLANVLARNQAPGQRDVYSTLGSLLGGGLGFGASVISENKKKKDLLNWTLPGGLHLSAKTAAFTDGLNKMMGQLPNIRGFDSAAGAVAGGTGGWLYNTLNKDKTDNRQQARHKLTNRILAGAGIGALGANVAGDRARRYISNKAELFSYQPKDIIPKNLKEIWDGAILDKPLASQPEGADPVVDDASRELFRQGMNVEPYNSLKNIWAKQQDGTFSINPASGNSDSIIKKLMFGYDGDKTKFDKSDVDYKGLLTDPAGYIGKTFNSKPNGDAGVLMGPLLGSQRTSLYPFNNGTAKPDYMAKILKRWDTRLKTPEKDRIKKYLIDKYIKHKNISELDTGSAYLGPQDDPASPSNPVVSGQDISASLKTDAEREIMQNILYKQSPWVSQRVYFKGQPNSPGYTAVPATASGQLYHDDSALQYQDDPSNPMKLVPPSAVFGH